MKLSVSSNFYLIDAQPIWQDKLFQPALFQSFAFWIPWFILNTLQGIAVIYWGSALVVSAKINDLSDAHILKTNRKNNLWYTKDELYVVNRTSFVAGWSN